ncbi:MULTISPECIES: hypothetical protein [Spirulina sp. CCY15215]|uniref:type II toxin-antitoxin system MazE family antitoxin n=1 Tax=Spirulina sp. CCY15215 TaxID=2767591 RepID=UPI00194ED681|nr:hypothetical protein [Spirulina major]
MSTSISITLDDEILRFIDERSRDRSRFINDLLLAEKRRVFLKELALAYKEQANDPEFQEEIAICERFYCMLHVS